MVVVGTDCLNEGQPMKKLLVALIFLGGCFGLGTLALFYTCLASDPDDAGGCFVASTLALSHRCLASDPGDSRAFGQALAVSEDYIAVGDPQANRVVLYQRDFIGRWTRREEILPPEGSTIAKAGAGFGYALDLEKEMLVIGAYRASRPIRRNEQGGYSISFSDEIQYFGAVYSALLEPNGAIELQEIPIRKTDLLVGYALSASGNQVAIGAGVKAESSESSGKVLIIDLTTNQISDVIEAPTSQSQTSFGSAVGLHDNILAVGSPLDPPQGGAWVFDLNHPKPPHWISGNNSFAGGSIAQGASFTAVSYHPLTWGNLDTVIVTGNNKKIVLERGGSLSIAGNLLSTARPRTPDLEVKGLVSVFEISDRGKAELLVEIPEGWQATLSDRFLVFTIKVRGRQRVCYRSIEEFN